MDLPLVFETAPTIRSTLLFAISAFLACGGSTSGHIGYMVSLLLLLFKCNRLSPTESLINAHHFYPECRTLSESATQMPTICDCGNSFLPTLGSCSVVRAIFWNTRPAVVFYTLGTFQCSSRCLFSIWSTTSGGATLIDHILIPVAPLYGFT